MTIYRQGEDLIVGCPPARNNFKIPTDVPAPAITYSERVQNVINVLEKANYTLDDLQNGTGGHVDDSGTLPPLSLGVRLARLEGLADELIARIQYIAATIGVL